MYPFHHAAPAAPRSPLTTSQLIVINDYVTGCGSSWEAGGVKVFSNKQVHDEYGPLMIRNNTARYNFGPGLWSDGGGWNISYIGNIMMDNALAGIHHEISFAATISGNLASGNCWRYAPWHAGGSSPWAGYCGQVTLSTSMNVSIERNTIYVDPMVAGNYAAVAMYQDPRGTDKHTNLVYKMRNNHVRHNKVVFKSTSPHIRTGVVEFDNYSEWKLTNITFDWNVYTVLPVDKNDPVFWWCNGTSVSGKLSAPCKGLTWAEFQAEGQEVHGTWTAIEHA